MKEGYVFDMEHEPTWQPFRTVCGLAFVGLSRATEFKHIAFRHVPDYWVFRAVADTALFQWRSTLERQLDGKHDLTSERQFFGKASVQNDLDRHLVWSEKITGAAMSSEDKADLLQMLSQFVESYLRQNILISRRDCLRVNLGGGRNKRKTMRGSNAAVDDPMMDEPDVEDTLTERTNARRPSTGRTRVGGTSAIARRRIS